MSLFALLTDVFARRRVAFRVSGAWLAATVTTLLPPLLTLGLAAREHLARVQWYSWLVLLAWPPVMTLLAYIARFGYFKWWATYQSFLQFEFQTVLPVSERNRVFAHSADDYSFLFFVVSRRGRPPSKAKTASVRQPCTQGIATCEKQQIN